MRNKCANGFDCQSMTGIADPMECPNRPTCNADAFAEEQANAVRELNHRGNPAHCSETLTRLYLAMNLLRDLDERLTRLNQNEYIAPPGCKVNIYSVKRGYGEYFYYKLAADEAIFLGVDQARTKVIHLKKADSALYRLATRGIIYRDAIGVFNQRLVSFMSDIVEILGELE